MASALARPWPSRLARLAREGQSLWTSGQTTSGQHPLGRKAGEGGALRHAGFRYTVLAHQSCHGVSHQTARSDLQ